jgi:hypothetical protein
MQAPSREGPQAMDVVAISTVEMVCTHFEGWMSSNLISMLEVELVQCLRVSARPVCD